MLALDRIHSLADFMQNHEEHLARLKETGTPELLTIDGKAELVLQDATSYQAMLERVRELEDLTAVRAGLAQADRGEARPADEFFVEFLSRNGIPG